MRSFLYKDFYDSNIQTNPASPLSEYIELNRSFFPYFKDCVGAIDGTHIPISPPENIKSNYRNRKGELSQNVLAVCNFDMRFTDILCGWEGSVSDSTLWVEGIRCGAIHVPDGKYLLGDAGFTNCDKCLTPYRATRYHLQEWKRDGRRPQNAKELFNLRHSKLRNVIERIFGVLKRRFKLLTLPQFFKIKHQVRAVAALCVLHNILVDIREAEVDEDQEEGELDQGDGEVLNEDQQSGRGYIISQRERTLASTRRDEIADSMWIDYIQGRQ
jgi:DDE superfamily endonuclease